MLTYNLTSADGPLYKSLSRFIKDDISKGVLLPDSKMPSKRTLAENLGVSTITVENAYDQLISEGYMYSILKKGYFVSDIKNLPQNSKNAKSPKNATCLSIKTPEPDNWVFDSSSNIPESETFPFSVWAKLTRKVISQKQKELLTVSPCGGVQELKNALANHLFSFRGMSVDPDQIIIGAGTEYLYGLIVKLLGADKIYCLENPGYTKLSQIYESNGARCVHAELDEKGLIVQELKKNNANIAHISPNHHFPTGITMPISRRYELLAWANEKDDRYIIEDDYDSEFRQKGTPIPPLQSIDAAQKVIYMNTFSKSLTSTIRISYMVLPEHLANEFYRRLSFYSCTVSTFEQYTLASFISEGYFEKHINRMRLHYGRKRAAVQEILKRVFKPEECRVIENDSGLHFILQLNTNSSDSRLQEKLQEEGIKIRTVSDYEYTKSCRDQHQFIINYSNINLHKLEKTLKRIQLLIN